MRGWILSIAAFGAAACGREVCSDPGGDDAPAMGDANGDGRVDLADGLRVSRWLTAGGAAPACAAAVDLSADGTVDLGDALSIWSYAFAGGVLPALAEGACGAMEPAEPVCGQAEVEIALQDEVAIVSLRSRELAIEGWQLSLVVEGCSVLGGEVEPSLNAAYRRVDLTDRGAVAVAALDWMTPRSLPSDGSSTPVLRLQVQTRPGERCRVALDDGQRGPGQAVESRLVASGLSFALDR